MPLALDFYLGYIIMSLAQKHRTRCHNCRVSFSAPKNTMENLNETCIVVKRRPYILTYILSNIAQKSMADIRE